MRYFQQFDTSDCGPACLGMILSFFDKSSTITELRSQTGTDISGTSFYGLKKAAEKNGLVVL